MKLTLIPFTDKHRLDGRSYKDRIGRPFYGPALREHLRKHMVEVAARNPWTDEDVDELVVTSKALADSNRSLVDRYSEHPWRVVLALIAAACVIGGVIASW